MAQPGPERRGPGLLVILVGLVVAAAVAARFFGFYPEEERGPGSTLPGQGMETRELSPQQGGRVGEVVPPPSAAPRVVIYHAHTSENYHPAKDHARDGAGEVLRVGQALAAALEARGIPTLHVTRVHDLPRYAEAFQRADQSLQEILQTYDTIEAIVDLHRDALPGRPDGYTTVMYENQPLAKVLLAVGTTDNPNLKQNLAFAEKVRSELEARNPELVRGIKILNARMNGADHPRALTVYVGEYHDNTVQEAEATAPILAEALAAALEQ